MKILLIEDNAGDIRLIHEMFVSSQEYFQAYNPVDLHYVETLEEGIRAISQNGIEAILLDLSLPDSQGLDTFRKIYELTKSLPIIILSGLDDEAIAVEAVREGAQDYLVKSRVDGNLLIRSIRYAIERNRILKEKDNIQEQLLQSQKMEAIGRLAGGIAHDFNNLMTAVQGFSDVIMMKLDDQNPIMRPLRQIRLAASNAASLTRQMLLFSRNHPTKFISLDLNQVIRELLKMLHRLIGEDIEISIRLEPDLCSIYGDKGTIEQVLMNLTVNAREAMPRGGKLNIRTENVKLNEQEAKVFPQLEAGNYVRMTVSDTGKGMDEAVKQHIFEPFYSTKGMANSSGLGLSVVYGIVEQHTGYIAVSSEIDVGTEFQIYLPAVIEKAQNHSDEIVSWEQFHGHDKRILLVEDSEGVREFAVMALRESGYQVVAVPSAEEAIKVFDHAPGNYDMVITDVVLPDKSGLELAEELIKLKPDLHIILSSGYTDQKLQWPVIQEKEYHFLNKPYSLSELLHAVRDVLEED